MDSLLKPASTVFALDATTVVRAFRLIPLPIDYCRACWLGSVVVLIALYYSLSYSLGFHKLTRIELAWPEEKRLRRQTLKSESQRQTRVAPLTVGCWSTLRGPGS